MFSQIFRQSWLVLIVSSVSCGSPEADAPQGAPESARNTPQGGRSSAESGDGSGSDAAGPQPAASTNPPGDRTQPVAAGEPAPGFRLKNQHGEEVSLEGLLQRGPVALAFFRSADW